MGLLSSEKPNISVCLRRTISVFGDLGSKSIHLDYGLRFNFCCVIDLPYEPSIGDIISTNRFVDLGTVEKRRIYSQQNDVTLKFYGQPTVRDNPFKLEVFLEEEKYRMYGETLEQNSIRDIHLFWLTLCDQFNRGFGMEDTDYYRFDVFSDEWYPKFDENEFRF